MKLSEIAQVFDLGSESGVTKTISRLGQRMENDAELLAEYNVLCQDLAPFGLYIKPGRIHIISAIPKAGVVRSVL